MSNEQPDRASLATQIYARLLKLEAAGCDSVRLIDLELQRMEGGFEHYGPLRLATDARDWNLEGIEEWLDRRMYKAAKIVSEEINATRISYEVTSSEVETIGFVEIPVKANGVGR